MVRFGLLTAAASVADVARACRQPRPTSDPINLTHTAFELNPTVDSQPIGSVEHTVINTEDSEDP